MSETKHTPTPWEWDPNLPNSWLRTVGDPYGHGQMHIADVMMRGWGHMTGRGGGLAWAPEKAAAVQEANAAFIVQAVNSYAERDALLRRAVEVLDELIDHEPNDYSQAEGGRVVGVFCVHCAGPVAPTVRDIKHIDDCVWGKLRALLSSISAQVEGGKGKQMGEKPHIKAWPEASARPHRR